MQCHSFFFHNTHNLIHLIPFTFHAVKFIYSQFPIFCDFLQITSFIGKRRRHISFCKHALPNYVLFSGIDFSLFFYLFFPPCIPVSKGGKTGEKGKSYLFSHFLFWTSAVKHVAEWEKGIVSILNLILDFSLFLVRMETVAIVM